MRILVAEALAREGLEILRRHHDVDEKVGLSAEEYRAILPEYDALVVRSQVKVDAEMIAAGTRLTVIGRAGVGVDNVDLDAATRAGITVVNAPTGNTIAAAELTLALLLALARKVAAADASMRRGEWKRSAFSGHELRGKTLGIVGLGKIGQAIAVRARALEMIVIGSDPFVTADQAARHGIELVPFEELLERSDAVTLHVPVTKATRGLIGAAELARMKPSAFLLNVARGAVVDEAALAAALHAGTIAGAGIDVYTSEPPTGNPLLEAPNTVLTPHLGASTAEAQVAGGGGGLAAGARRPGRPARALRRECAPPDAGDRARDRAVPAARGDAGSLLRPVRPRSHAGAHARGGGRAGRPRRHAPPGSGPPRPPRGNDDRAGQPRQRRPPRKGAGDHPRRAQDARCGRVRHARRPWRESADGFPHAVAGTLANGEQRLVRLDDYELEMAPAPWMLVTRHQDRPGMMGRIGLMLGEADINISAMHLGRSAPRSDAFMLLALDEAVPDDVADHIRAMDGVLDIWSVELGDSA